MSTLALYESIYLYSQCGYTVCNTLYTGGPRGLFPEGLALSAWHIKEPTSILFIRDPLFFFIIRHSVLQGMDSNIIAPGPLVYDPH